MRKSNNKYNITYSIIFSVTKILLILVFINNFIYSQSNIKIGVALPLFTESDDKNKQQLGNEILDGIKFALQKYSKNTDVKITLEVVDTKRDPGLTADLIKSFGENEEIIGVIGPIYSSELNESAHYAQSYKLPVISPTATGDDLASNYNYVYQLNPSYEVRGKLMARYLMDKFGFKNFAVIYEDTYGDNFRKHFENEVKSKGGKVLISQSYKQNPQSITEQINNVVKFIKENDLFINASNLNLKQRQKLESLGVRWSLLDSSVTMNMDISIYYMLGKNAAKILDTINIKPYKLKQESVKFIQGIIDAIYIPISNAAEINVIVPQLFSDGLGMNIAGTGDWNNENILENNKIYLKNVIFESEYYLDDNNIEYKNLLEAVKKTKYKITKNFLFGYDAANLIFNLVNNGAKTRENLNSSLKNLAGYDAIKSKISLDYHGINSELNILKYDNKIILIERYKISK